MLTECPKDFSRMHPGLPSVLEMAEDGPRIAKDAPRMCQGLPQVAPRMAQDGTRIAKDARRMS